MDENRTSYIGNRDSWGGTKPFGLQRADRRHHVYAIGKTGSGKTTLLRNLILQDIEACEGVGVIDAHGDLAHELLVHVPPSRADDVVYLNPADHEWPVGFNLLESVPPERRHLVASGIVAVFKSIWETPGDRASSTSFTRPYPPSSTVRTSRSSGFYGSLLIPAIGGVS